VNQFMQKIQESLEAQLK